MTISARVGCSSISFRGRSLPDALVVISGLGFREIDLGALPGVCDHVPYELDSDAVEQVVGQIAKSGLGVRSVNGDVGDLNACLDSTACRAREEHLARLLELTARIGAIALVLPCGALGHQPLRGTLEADLDVVSEELNAAVEKASHFGVELWTESLHSFRLSCDTSRADMLHRRLDPRVGIVMDFSHVTASGGDVDAFAAANVHRIRHVHLRDARPGDIHVSIGCGDVDFAAGLERLRALGYSGHFALELETRDVTDAERPAAAKAAGEYITGLLS